MLSKISNFCNMHASSKIRDDCTNSLTPLQSHHLNNIKKFSSISYLISNQQPQRFKRGLIDGGGSLLKTFFGTLDNDDAVAFNEAISQVQSDEKQLAHLMKNNIHVIMSTISNFNASLAKLNENSNRINKNLDIINKSYEQIINSNDKLDIQNRLNTLLNILESLILTSSFDLEDINNAILFSKINILHPSVLSPYQLFTELEHNSNYLPKYCEFPIAITQHNVHELIDISNLISYYSNNKIVIVLKIPLVLPQTYTLYRVIPLPVPHDITKPDSFALISPNTRYVAMTTDRMMYSLLDSVEKCKVIRNVCYVCELTNVLSTIANPTCETLLLSEVRHSLPRLCNAKILYGSIDVFEKINNNKWIYVQSEPGKMHISCDNDLGSHDQILFGTGILSLPKNCKGFYKTLQFTPSDEIVTNITVTFSNFNIVNDECCEQTKLNKSISYLPFVKLSNVNMDSLLHASTQLKDFEKDLNKLEEPSHLQKYSTHYLSVTYVLTILFLLYILYKLRKYICHSDSKYCIKIYNQCNTKKINRTETQDYRMSNIEIEDHFDDLKSHSARSLPTPLRRNIIK